MLVGFEPETRSCRVTECSVPPRPGKMNLVHRLEPRSVKCLKCCVQEASHLERSRNWLLGQEQKLGL